MIANRLSFLRLSLAITLLEATGHLLAAAPAGPSLPHGLRGAVEIPDPSRWWRLGGLTVLLLGIVGLGFWLWWRRRGGHPAAPGARPDDVARQRLQRALELVDQPEPFVAEVSAAVRAYLESRFGWRAPERTTEEFIEELGHNGALAPGDQSALAQFLGACDLVKFAGHRPGRSDLEDLHVAALRLVNELAPMVQPGTGLNSGATEGPVTAAAQPARALVPAPPPIEPGGAR